MSKPGPGSVDEELRIARALLRALIAERESLMALTQEQRSRALASAETVIDLIEKIEQLVLKRHTLLQSKPLSHGVVQ
jgi:hypothetical protein